MTEKKAGALLRPKSTCRACLAKAWDSLGIAQNIESGLPARAGAYYCQHKHVLTVYVLEPDSKPICTCITGLSYQEAKQWYAEAVAAGGGTLDIVAKIRKEGMH